MRQFLVTVGIFEWSFIPVIGPISTLFKRFRAQLLEVRCFLPFSVSDVRMGRLFNAFFFLLPAPRTLIQAVRCQR